MKKKFILICCLIMCSILFAIVGFAFSQNQYTADVVDFKIVINSKEHKFTQPIVTIDNSTYLPVRELFEKLGYDVDWENTEKMVTISEKQQFIFNDDTFTSREETLENGLKYIFYGTDKNIFSVDEKFRVALEQKYFLKERLYDIEFQSEETIETIAEKILGFLSLEEDISEKAVLEIYYDAEIQTLIFSLRYYEPRPGVGHYILVNSEDGTTFLYKSCLY